MDSIINDLGIPSKNVFTTASNNLFTVVVHNAWLKKWLKNTDIDLSVNNIDFSLQPGESVPYPYKKVFIKVLHKKVSKVLPLPRYKLCDSNIESPLTFPQLLQYVSQNNNRNLWKESYRKYCQNNDSSKESAIVNLMEHDHLLSEVILRLYSCNIIKIKTDLTGKLIEYKEIIPNKYVSRSYETHANLLAAIFTLETDLNFFIIYNGHYDNNLLDCLNFSPNLIDLNYSRGLFVIYQLLNVCKAMCDRGLGLGSLNLQDIYLSENLWLQVSPAIINNVCPLDGSQIFEQSRNKQSTSIAIGEKGDEWSNDVAQLEKLCMLWVRGRISNLDYLLYLNMLAGRSANDPQAYTIVPWVTDFSSRCGRSWRDLSKSKYRLTKGDRQLDMTYDAVAQDSCPGQIPHHVTDALSDITCYVYLARRTPKEVLCKYVRNKWVPAEYPASIQRMQEWTPDECIPEFYTDPLVFKSIHEDLPDLGIPSWATCVEDFITKHREALESTHVSENLHHWIDLTFGYKLSGAASVKAKNVCLSLVDGHTRVRRGAAVQLLAAPHPARRPRARPAAPPRLHWTLGRAPAADDKKPTKGDESSDAASDDEEESRRARPAKAAPSQPRHYRVQRSELGKGVVHLPKEYNPVASIQALEALDNFRTRCFFSKSEEPPRGGAASNLVRRDDAARDSDENSFTNHMFLASYERNYLKKATREVQLENVLKERKGRSGNARYTTDAAVYKRFVTEGRRRDMLVMGCLIVEIFLHAHVRPLRLNADKFVERYTNCRTVLKYNFNSLPKCVSYVASLLLNVEPPTLSFRSELSSNRNPVEGDAKVVVTDKGLPPPTPAQLLQPLLAQHLIPFSPSFGTLYNLLATLHEYQLTSNELNILYMYECDGVHCDKYQNVDKTKLYFSQRIAEGKIQACANHLDILLGEMTSYSQFDVLDIFLPHYIELLENRETSVLAAWYLFDTVSKSLGPDESRKKLLRHILNLYEDDDFDVDKSEQNKMADVDTGNVFKGSPLSKHKFVKLYHNIFLLQLMVRFGLECFLDNFTQHLVEAVGGYKDADANVGSPGHLCHDRPLVNKKPRYSDEHVKNVLSTTSDIFSPDTSYGSEPVVTPNVERVPVENDTSRDSADNRSESEVFHFETDKESRLPSRSSRSKSPTESIDSYTLNAPHESAGQLLSPSPMADAASPQSKCYSSNVSQFSSSPTRKFEPIEVNVKEVTATDSVTPTKAVTSPTIEIPRTSMFTSYLHFAEDDVSASSEDNEFRKGHRRQTSKSFEFNRHVDTHAASTSTSKSLNEGRLAHDVASDATNACRISDVSSESLLWLSHRLGPVLTCRHITRNLLKMLTLCYIGKENLVPLESDTDSDEFDSISIANSKVVGDRNAAKVIKCLTSIVAMYGEQLILFQYLPHMGELIASCRRRLSAPLEGGVIACLHLLKYLIPLMSDAKLMEQLQDALLRGVLHPALRLAGSARALPGGARARRVLARKLLDALHALAARVGPEMTRRHLCVPALQRFFLTFDKASGKTENWPNIEQETNSNNKTGGGAAEWREGYLELCRDGSTAEWAVRGGLVRREDGPPDLACSPPAPADAARRAAQEELLMVFNDELAHQAYVPFLRFVGADALERNLKNHDTIHALCQNYDRNHATDPPCNIRHGDKRVQCSFSDEGLSRKMDITQPNPKSDVMDHISSSNSFGSNVTLVGNRIDVAADVTEDSANGVHGNVLDVVSYKMDNGVKSNRHLRGDWLIYWEHEIGRPDKENRFNLKQIKLQQFTGHTQAVKSICCLDNENSFMSGSKDKTVRLWSLRNQGDGGATTQCNWTYTGHKRGVLSLAFLESRRLAVSTDSVVHIWDPFMESVVSQLDNMKSAVSIVRAMPGPSAAVVAATADATLKIIDARSCNYTHELKLPWRAWAAGGGGAAGGGVRCLCAAASGRWLACGLASGHVVVLDARAGVPRAAWRAHDGEVLRLAAVGERLLSTGLDQAAALWSAADGELLAQLKGTTEPVHCLSVYHNELISGTTNNRIGVHTALDTDASFSSTKLRSDTFKGILTCMSVLPLNRLLLLGSDNGSISLLC